MAVTYEPIATLTGTGTFTSIPQTYTDLRIVGATDSGGQNIEWRYNSDASSLYSNTFLNGSGAVVTSVRLTNQAQVYGAYSFSSGFGFYEIDIFNYTAGGNKAALCRFHNDANGSGYITLTSSLWRSTAAITSISIQNNGGTPLTLYGIKAA